MGQLIRITIGNITIKGELNESPTAEAISRKLPIKGNANTWGEEIYFEIPVAEKQAPDAREDMDLGELGYWPVGRALCIFFGPTPVSTDDKPRAASPVNPIGRLIEDPSPLRKVKSGTGILIEAES
jgi:hypothetical protein